jgi:hypothetical protein
MAIVRSVDGTFYEVPDGDLEQYKVPPDQVKGLMEGAGQKVPSGPQQQQQQQQQTCKPMGEAGAGSPQILVQFIVQGNTAPQQQPAAAQQQQPPAGADEEKVEPQNYYWVNWYNWSNWYNWY